MNLRFLNTVIAVSQMGSLNAAAQALGLSHSAVSLQIKALEEELAFRILDRSKRPPVLTGEGLALVEHARRMEDVASDIRALADGSRLHGRATLGVVPSTISNLAAPALAALHAEHPGFRIELVSALSQRLVDLTADGTLDCALVTDPGGEDGSLDFQAICAEPFRLICAESRREETSEELLANCPYIWFDRRSRLSRQVEAYLFDLRIRVQGTMEVDSFEAAEALVRHDLGVSILPRRALSMESPGVRSYVLPGHRLERRVVLASRRTSPRRLLIQKLGLALRAVLRAHDR